MITDIDEIKTVLLSPVQYNSCVVDVETKDTLLFRITDEPEDECLCVEIVDESSDNARIKVSLMDFKRLIDQAAARLEG